MKNISVVSRIFVACLCCINASLSDLARAAGDSNPILRGQGEPVLPVITEFVASNKDSLIDSDGDSSDWIEIYNPAIETLNLDGWFLTDDLSDLAKWQFPAVQLAPGGYLVVFASGRDLRDPAGQLHTNFSLQADGESLALFKPDGWTLAFAYADYPPQLVDVSYGISSGGVSQNETLLVAQGAAAKALIPTGNSLGLAWTRKGFDDSAWLAGATGVGFDYAGYTSLDVGAMRNVNRTVYVRIPFQASGPADIDKLILRMQFEDGFVAWLNGVEVALASALTGVQLTWDSGATANREDADAVVPMDFDITQYKAALVEGDNVLAIQGLNSSLSSSDLLILPELVAVKIEQIDLDEVIESYFLHPTPGAANPGSVAQMGPEIRNVTKNPTPPSASEDLVIAAEVSPTLAAIAGVRLQVRVNYEVENRMLPAGGLVMADDGSGVDATAGDGVYTAVIPRDCYDSGDMVRWYVTAEDASGHASRNPLFPSQGDWPQYYGTVVTGDVPATTVPVLQWFAENPGAATSRNGTRASVFFDGEFYDNIFVRQRGGATVGAGSKKFVFNNGYKFRFSNDSGRIAEFNLNQNGSDPSYIRQPLAFETHRLAGCPSSLCFFMLSVLNQKAEGVRVFVEQVDEEFLERNGFDSRGALYKFTQRSRISPVFSDVSTGIEKKTREYENFSDIAAVIAGLNAATAEERKIFVFDNFNLPEMLNYLAARCLLQDTDDIRKNFYFYRDTEGNGEWSIFPWDKDWTFGIEGDGWIYTSHPFLGDVAHPKNNGLQWSIFLDVMYNLPETQEMFLRRTRTVMDELLQPASTPVAQRFFENRIVELYTPARPLLGNLDSAVNSLKSYFPTRRAQLYVDHNIDNTSSKPAGGNAGIPNSQPDQVTLAFGDFDFDPVSGDQDEEYVEIVNPNLYAVDLSGWRLEGGVNYTFAPGTVVVAWGRLYVSPNVRSFRSRAMSPTGGEGLFVQGDYKGHLSNSGETVTLLDRDGRTVDTLVYSGASGNP